MSPANRCPSCRGEIRPFAATCPWCATDLDAWRRRRAAKSRRFSLRTPSFSNDVTDLVLLVVIMLLLALFAPLFALFIVWHSHHNGLPARRNVASVCAALSIFNLVAPQVLLVHLP